MTPATVENAGTSKEKKGRGRGTKDTLTQAEIRRLGPMAHKVMYRLLRSAQQTKDLKLAARLFDSVSPFLLRKQPQEIWNAGQDGKNIVHEVKVSIVSGS